MPSIDVERPLALVLLVLIPVLCWLAWRRRGVVGRGKTIATMVLRGVLVMMLSLALAQPSLVRKGEGLTVMVVFDASRSVPQSMQQQAQKLVDGLVASKREAADRVGLVTFAGRPEVRAVAESDASLDVSQHGGDRMSTGIEGALRRGMAMLPPDTASRMLLISDGNQTSGNALEAAEAARANGIPIDVVALPFSHASEVMVESLRAPSTAREGQTIDLRASIRSMGPNRGVVTLRENGEPVDLDPSAPGTGLAVELKAGVNALTFPMVVVGRQSRRYELVYTPDDPASDAIAENNRGAAMVLVSTGAKVVIVDGSDGGEESQPLVAALAEGDIPSRVITPDELDTEGVSALADADAVVLANVGRFEITNETDQLLHSYVHDLGGGLLVTGGDRAFGAGGWQGSEASKAFAVKLEPPATRQLPKGALVLVMHSCEMAAGNYWGEKVAEAAVDALSRLDLAGIVTFDWGGKDGKLASWAHDLQPVGDKSTIRAAIKKMVVGDMPDFKASLSLAKEGLSKANAGQKHIIIISDGDPSPPTQADLDELKRLKITVTTIMVGGHGTSIDLQNMRAVAEQTGGTFYNVQNPNLLPKIFTKEATLVSRTLILEQTIRPVVEQSTGGPMDGSGSLPEVNGWVVTVPREGLAQVPAVLPTKESRDPLVAYWNYGLGKSVAFTSDLGGRWGRPWATWSGYQPFWTRALRWMMRPPTAQDLLVSTSVDGDVGRVQVSAFTADGEPRDFLRSSATLMRPDGTVEVLDLQQTAPGQYVASFDAREQGAYLASVSARDGMGADRSARSVVSVPYPRELSATRDDSALLRRIAEVSGGRVITLKDASTVDFFDRSGLSMPEAAKRIWNVLAIVAAALLIIDVAARRITLDREAARDLAAMAVGEGAKTGGATVEAWKRARSGARKAPGEPVATAPAAPTKPDRRVTPSAPVEIVDRTQAKPNEPSSDAPSTDDASSLARLRAAKRRARGEEDAS
ncbi:MAG: hypothetical protein RL527_1678 [Planctomycetota bacterium]